MHVRHVHMEIQLQAQPEFKGNSFAMTLTRHIHMKMAPFAPEIQNLSWAAPFDATHAKPKMRHKNRREAMFVC